MFGGLIAFIAIVALVVVAQRQQKRLRVLEADLQDLRKAFLSRREAVTAPATLPAEADAASPAGGPDLARRRALRSRDNRRGCVRRAGSRGRCPGQPPLPAQETRCSRGGAGRSLVSSGAAPSRPAAAKPARPTIETALGTRWAVWVGGLALALGGIFLVRYSIEAGIFGPEVRLIMAGVLGIALVAAGEFIRRTGFRMPVEGVANAYVPGILDGRRRLHAVRHRLCRAWHLRLHRPVRCLHAARR